MTSLQQTAMGGGSATAKTASYVLVAADAGTTVAMNAAGATTITVNTGLFAAGDTVFIQNLGAGACTVTAGTATVATAGSLILPQNDAGILYFTATGAAIFYDYIQAGAVSPLTTKGDVYTFSTSDARLAVGANNTVLTADSAEATGLKWATVAAGGITQLATGSLNGVSSVTISSISQSYKHLYAVVQNQQASSGSTFIRPNNYSTANYSGLRAYFNSSSWSTFVNNNGMGDGVDAGATADLMTFFEIPNYTLTGYKILTANVGSSTSAQSAYSFGRNSDTTAVTSLVIRNEDGVTYTSGTYTLYGVS